MIYKHTANVKSDHLAAVAAEGAEGIVAPGEIGEARSSDGVDAFVAVAVVVPAD